MTQVIPILSLDGRFIGNIVNELPKRHPETRAEASGEVVPPSRTFSDSPSGRVGSAAEVKSSLPSLCGAFNSSSHISEVA